LAKVAKLAGAPLSKGAGVELQVNLGTKVEVGQTLFTIYAESMGELEYALSYVEQHPLIMGLEAQ
jgi:thymidine phosphorylase